MITVMDCAEACKAIYKNQDFGGYILQSGMYDPKNSSVKLQGYSLGVYKSTNDPSTYLLSIRGSAKTPVVTKDWYYDDVQIGLGMLPDRTNDAISYTRNLLNIFPPNSFVLIVGHSLGGFIAQYLGVVFDLPFVTFNAPPALGTFSNRFPDGTRVGNYDMGLNYRVNYDPVSKTPGKHVGWLEKLPLAGQAHAGAHKMGVVLGSVRAAGLVNTPALTEIIRLNA